MMRRTEYLTDEELQILIREAEADESVPAPPDFKADVLKALEKEAGKEDTALKHTANTRGKKKNKQKEMITYSLRVAMSVAAAVVFVFTMQYFQELQSTQNPGELPETEQRETNCPSREEVLNETDIFEKIFGSEGMLKETNYFDFFEKEMEDKEL